jgi:hypothetical protein
MGHEFIGECPGWVDDPESDDLETELAIKFIKQSCGPPPRSVDVQVTFEGSEVGNEGDEVSYPVISVVWDDGVTEYPGEFIGKCIEAFERFELPEEIHRWYQDFFELQEKHQEMLDRISQARWKNRRLE